MENLEKFLEDYPAIVTLEKSKKIIEQIEKCICRIYSNGQGSEKTGTGFFCYLKNEKDKQKIPVMITNNHVIDENFYNNKKEIKISLNNEKIYKDIKLDSKRIKYTSAEYDITIIELRPEKDGIYSFLEIDERIFQDNSNKIFNRKSSYIIQYPEIYNASVSYGLINLNDDCDKITHFCQATSGSSGSPILNLDSNMVIGVHFGAPENPKFKYNNGTFLKKPINEFFSYINKNNSINKDDNNEKNEINITVKIDKDEINREIYFLDNTTESLEKDIKNPHSNLPELNPNNTELYINEKKLKYQKFFIPTKEGNYQIKLKLNTLLRDCSYMFYYCKNINRIDFSSFNTQNVTNMSNMFYYCLNLTNLNLSSFNTEKVTNMSNLFSYCLNLSNIALSSFNTKNVTNMSNMFSFCNKLTDIDISFFHVPPNLKAEHMFQRCLNLKNIKMNKQSKEILLKYAPDNDGIKFEFV